MTEHELQLLAWAQHQCAQQEVSPFAMRQKLTKRGANSTECNHILEALEAYVHDKFCFDRWGRLKISYKLTANHQITQTVINKALLQLNAEEELQLLEGLLRGKVKENEPLTEELKMKLLRFSEQRGFTKTQFFAVLRRIKESTDE